MWSPNHLIVTCDACKSRYKLDDAKITGKGAKITCPKCRNVFVVYARTEAAPSGSPAGSGATDPTAPGGSAEGGPPSWEPPKSGGLADAVKAADRGDAAPGRVVAGREAPSGVGVAAPAAAWDDEPTRVGQSGASDDPSEEVGRAAAAPARDSAEIAARAASLDFRKVGVTTWKVKVKIGLIYDFSDIKTLRKYIQDGRVTPADVVSWDGKSWRAIGDIPDLDSFFVDTWDALAARKADAPPPTAPAVEPRAEERPAAPPAGGPVGEPTQFHDPFSDLKRKQRDRADLKRTGPVAATTPKKVEAPPPPRSRAPVILAALVGVLLAAFGAAWWMNQAPPASSASGAGASKSAGSGRTPEQIRKDINKGLEETLAGNPAPELPPEEGEPDTRIPVPPDRVAVPPDRVAVPPDRPSGTIPEGAVARPPRNVTTSAPNMKQADQTAADHEAVGDDAMRGRDWSTAAQAYKKAVALDAGSARLAGKLGKALFEAGDLGGAQPLLSRAAKAGVTEAHKYLGHIARQQGDTAEANSQYQQYLKGSPTDAADIEQIIAQMSGG